MREVQLDLNKGVLNLNKNEFLNLSKASVSLERLRLAAGWDVIKKTGFSGFFGGGNADLDLVAYLQDSTGRVVDTVYYAAKRAQGIYLDGDNLTGEGDGDDENIYVELAKLHPAVEKITFAVVIYSAHTFQDVQNAYVRLVNEQDGRELVRYNLSSEGGFNKAVKCAELTKVNGDWNFVAVGTYHNKNIEGLKGEL